MKHLKFGGTTLQGHFSFKLKGHFLKIEGTLCLLQNLGGAHAPSAPGFYGYDGSWPQIGHKITFYGVH